MKKRKREREGGSDFSASSRRAAVAKRVERTEQVLIAGILTDVDYEGDDQKARGRGLGSVGGIEEGGRRLRSNAASSKIRLQRFRRGREDGGGLVMEDTPDMGRLKEERGEKGVGSAAGRGHVSKEQRGATHSEVDDHRMRLNLAQALSEVDHLHGSFRRSGLEQDAPEGDRGRVRDLEREDCLENRDELIQV